MCYLFCMRDTSKVQEGLTRRKGAEDQRAGDQVGTGVDLDAGIGVDAGVEDDDVEEHPGQEDAAQEDAAQWHRPSRAERRIGIRELRQHASIYVDLAEKGYTVDITNRGRLVAQLVPAREPESPMERLMAAGLIEPADDPGDLRDLEPLPPRPPSQAEPADKPTLTDAFLRMREEEH
jgi:prevent-host-death family protein